MATIKDVAQAAGVSVSTASRSMHNSPLISEATKAKVRYAMTELNYTPNVAAQNLVNQHSNMFGIVLPNQALELAQNPFFMQVIQGINQYASEQNVMISLATGQDDERLLSSVRLMVEGGNISNFILMYSKNQDPIIDYLHQRQIRHVVIGHPYQYASETLWVDNDNEQAAVDATNHLVDEGCQAIGFLYSNLDEIVQVNRSHGYQKAIERQHQANYSLKTSMKSAKYDTHIRTFLEANPQIDGIVAVDDILGLKIQEVSLAMNRPIKIIGFNNSLFASVISPGFSSVEILPEQLGLMAAKLMTSSIERTNQRQNGIIVPHRIVQR